ncbi:MAG: hypothetical protein L0Y56_11630 [Nitrospira sp.]|nr:hypothetical protein [Nitrospira sp.]
MTLMTLMTLTTVAETVVIFIIGGVALIVSGAFGVIDYGIGIIGGLVLILIAVIIGYKNERRNRGNGGPY